MRFKIEGAILNILLRSLSMKNACFLPFIFWMLLPISAFSYDCQQPSMFVKYLTSDVILYVEITQQFNKKKWGFKMLKKFKGQPLDTLSGNFRIGDKVIVYGRYSRHTNAISTHICSGNRFVERILQENYPFPSPMSKAGLLELKTLKFYKRQFGEMKVHLGDVPRFKMTDKNSPNLFLYNGFSNLERAYPDLKVAYVEFLFDENCEVLEINFLNKTAKANKADILEHLQKGKWQYSNTQNAPPKTFRVIKSIIYPVSMRTVRDF